jgi:hypothetical protein
VYADLAVFAVELLIIVTFIIVMTKYLGIKLDLVVFIRELRELLSLKITPESLNAMFMIGLALLSLLMIVSTMVSGWRRLAYFLLGSDAESLQVIPAFTMFVILLGTWILAGILSTHFCLKHRRLMNSNM